MKARGRTAAPHPADQVRTDLPIRAVLQIFCACGSLAANDSKSRKKQICGYCRVQVWPPTANLAAAARAVVAAYREA
jgi:hypothetical protein